MNTNWVKEIVSKMKERRKDKKRVNLSDPILEMIEEQDKKLTKLNETMDDINKSLEEIIDNFPIRGPVKITNYED